MHNRRTCAGPAPIRSGSGGPRESGDNAHDQATTGRIDVPDLRRRDARLRAEQIAQRAEYLPPHERALVLSVYGEGRPMTDVAALAGVPVRTLRREVRRVVRRLAGDEFVFVAVNFETWSGTLRRVAQCCVLHGEPVRQAASTLRLSLHTVRKYRGLVRIMAAGARASTFQRSRAG